MSDEGGESDSGAGDDRYPDKRREASVPKGAAVKTAVKIPKPPKFLDREAKKYFKEFAAQIAEQGVLRHVDWPTLAMLAQALSDFSTLTIEIRSEGKLKKGPNGGDVWNQKVGLLKDARKTINECSDRLGLSAKARASIKYPEGELPDGDDDEDPEQLKFNEFLRERAFVRGESWNGPPRAPGSAPAAGA